MFVTKKYHQMEIKHLEEQISALTDSRLREVSLLKSQIEDLRKMVFPATPSVVEPMVMEADSVIEGNEKPYQLSEEQYNKLFDEAREASLLLSGDYSDGLVQ